MQSQNTADTTDTTYNDWPNRETWLVDLWLTNDQGTYNALEELVSGIEPDVTEFGTISREHRIADALVGFVDDLIAPPDADVEYGLAVDLITTALGRVDWRELADNYAEDFPFNPSR